jgi:hypothetical protein
MSNKDLFKEAIADAKAVREAALANAKAALEEALAPKLQNMISAKLQEMESDEELDEAKDKEELDEMELGQDNYATDDIQRVNARKLNASLEEGEDELEEDFDLSEILAELSKEDELDEAKKKEDKEEIDEAKKKEDLDEAEEGEEEEEEEEEEVEDEPEIEDEPSEDSDEKITDLTVDELKDIIKDIISAEMGGGEVAADMGDMGGDEMGVGLDNMGGEEEDKIAVDEMYDDKEEIDEIDLEELLAELDALGEKEDDDLPAPPKEERPGGMFYEKKSPKKAKEDEKEMKEALATIETLRNELNEVNLLNAKLLYVNKIFKAKNLNESQKLKVIAQFDKATTAKEAKTIFESMNSAIAKSKKSTLKESIGFASKAAGVAPKKPIVEVNETVSRWQMLAGITKF